MTRRTEVGVAAVLVGLAVWWIVQGATTAPNRTVTPRPTTLPTPTPPVVAVVAGANLRWTLLNAVRVETLEDKDTRLRSTASETWLVVQATVKTIGDRTVTINERNGYLRFRPKDGAEWLQESPDYQASSVASHQFGVPNMGAFVGTRVRLNEEKRVLIAFRVRRALDALELWLQDASTPIPLPPA